MNHRYTRLALLVTLALALLHGTAVLAGPVRSPLLQTTPVTSKTSYQGQLSDATGTPLTGSYSFRFEWYAAPTGGTALWHQTISSVQVQNGLFTVQLDVQPAHMDGKALWLDITVNGQRLSPRQELLPAPYAFTLRPGAQVEGNTSDTLLDVVNTGGVGISGYSEASYGVFGQTLDDAEYYSAGVRGHSAHERTAGVMGTSDSGFGVYGQISDAANTHSAVVGYNDGQGNGVSGVSINKVGVYGEAQSDTEWETAGVHGHSTHDNTFGVLGTSDDGIGVAGDGGRTGVLGNSESGDGVAGFTDSATSYAGRFENRAEGGAGLRAEGGTLWDPDLLLGGSTGTIYSDPDHAASEVKVFSQSYVTIDLDDNDDDEAWFTVRGGDDELAFAVNEDGHTYVAKTLTVGTALWTKGAVCWYLPVSDAGLHPMDVPDFCTDAFCWIIAEFDATVGAFTPGLMWPTMYMQDARRGTDSWIAGPNIGIAGVGLGGGPGVNGDGTSTRFGFDLQDAEGGLFRLLDDSSVENEADQWTVEFQPAAGGFSQGTVYACPLGQDVALADPLFQTSAEPSPPMVSE